MTPISTELETSFITCIDWGIDVLRFYLLLRSAGVCTKCFTGFGCAELLRYRWEARAETGKDPALQKTRKTEDLLCETGILCPSNDEEKAQSKSFATPQRRHSSRLDGS